MALASPPCSQPTPATPRLNQASGPTKYTTSPPASTSTKTQSPGPDSAPPNTPAQPVPSSPACTSPHNPSTQLHAKSNHSSPASPSSLHLILLLLSINTSPRALLLLMTPKPSAMQNKRSH